MDISDFLPMTMMAATEPITDLPEISLWEPEPAHPFLAPSQFLRLGREFELFSTDAAATAIGTDALGQYGLPARSRPATAAARQAVDVRSQAERIADERIRLLAAKYARGPGQTEVLARLEILNERMLEAVPRVTVAQVEFLERAASELDAVRARRIERAQRLGLQPDA